MCVCACVCVYMLVYRRMYKSACMGIFVYVRDYIHNVFMHVHDSICVCLFHPQSSHKNKK